MASDFHGSPRVHPFPSVRSWRHISISTYLREETMQIKKLAVSAVSCLFMSWAVCVNTATAQSTFGTVLGTVKDASGSVIPNASVKITNVDENTSRSIQTNANGDYEAVNTKPGRYSIEVSTKGFHPFNTSAVTLI